MKNPNRFGTVTKLSGNRRKPWIAREGQSGRQKVIGYAATRQEALSLLVQYNDSPWDIDARKITLEELYTLWKQKKAPKIGKYSVQTVQSGWGHCKMLSDEPYTSIKYADMQRTIDGCGERVGAQKNVQNFWYHMDTFAAELEISNKWFSRLLKTDTLEPKEKTIFTTDEVRTLWQCADAQPAAAVAVFMLYTGFRAAEACSIELRNVDFENRTIKGGMKTAAGKNRIVPIHPAILALVKSNYKKAVEAGESYLFLNLHHKRLTPETFKKLSFPTLMKKTGMSHTTHECRHTFRTALDAANGNAVCIDRIMGHASGSIGERVYTHKTVEELRKTIELVSY